VYLRRRLKKGYQLFQDKSAPQTKSWLRLCVKVRYKRVAYDSSAIVNCLSLAHDILVENSCHSRITLVRARTAVVSYMSPRLLSEVTVLVCRLRDNAYATALEHLGSSCCSVTCATVCGSFALCIITWSRVVC